MAVSPARAVAFEILLRVEREDAYASELLHADRLSTLHPRDHGLATELVMGVLRWQSLLDRQLASVSSQALDRLDAEVLAAVRLGAYQIQFLSRVPARAAIFESVELVKAARKRSAASFVNAVLRALARAGPQDFSLAIANASDSVTLALAAAHPLWLVERWTSRYGIDAARLICAYDQTVPNTAIHIHPQADRSDSASHSEIEVELAAAGVGVAPGRLLSASRRVLAGDVTKTLAYREGRLSIQDEASQLVALLAGRAPMTAPGAIAESAETDGAHKAGVNDDVNKDGAILDCCAAPGGKTAVLARRNPLARVFATDLHPHRARLLQNLNRLPNVRVVAADARALPFSRGFDCILADVPCSGTGTLARNPEIKWRLKDSDLRDLQARQLAILKSALSHLAAGGRLVYSTCSLETEENEAVVDAALGGAPEFAIVDLKVELEQLRQEHELSCDDDESLLAGPYLRTIPGVHACDGFFAAMIERR